MLSSETKRMINVLKFFCIFSVICAHTNSITMRSDSLTMISSSFLNILGTIGVSIFFIISGFLYYYNTDKFTFFLKKKVKNLVIPWVITGTIVFFYVYIRKGNINILNWFDYVIGNGTYLYYMSMLSVNYLLFFKLKHNKGILYLSIMFSFLCFLGEYNGIYIVKNPYVNILNWCGYFSVGILIAKCNILDKIVFYSKKWNKLFSASWILFVIYLILFEKFSYWNKLYIPFELISIMNLVYYSNRLNRNKILIDIGKQSYAIYLLHMLLVGLINYSFVFFKIEFLLLIKPIIILIIMYILILFIKKLSQKLHINCAVYLGIR